MIRAFIVGCLRDLRLHRGGICGHHMAPRSMVGKAFWHGFYWQTAVANAQHIVRTCEGCQYYSWQTHLPVQEL
jgi:hypothetical protein